MADSGFSRAEIIAMAEDALRQLNAAQGLDFEAEKARRMLRNHKVGAVDSRGESTKKYQGWRARFPGVLLPQALVVHRHPRVRCCGIGWMPRRVIATNCHSLLTGLSLSHMFR